MRRTPRRLIAVSIAAVALVALVPASAQALTVSGTGAPTNLQAGAHSNFAIHVAFSPSSQDVHDITIGLPPGEVGDPNATPQCTHAQLHASTPSCPASSEVGTTTVNATLTLLGLLPVTQNVSGTIYNVVPQTGEPARFGIVLHPLPIPGGLGDVILPPIVLESAVHLRQSDFGLDTVINPVPKVTPVPLVGDVATHINSMDVHLDGVAPNTGKPFLRNPTSCSPHYVAFTAHPYSPATGTATANAPSFTPTSCGSLDFSPSFTAEVGGPGQTAAGRIPTTAITSIDQDPDEAGLIKAMVAVPPADFFPNLGLFAGACQPADFQAGACAPASVVGSAIAASPLLSQPLSGNVMLVQNGSPIPDLGLDLNGQLHLLLKGTLSLSQVVTFDGLPDIPIAHFQLTFGPSPGFLETNRDLCVPPAPLFHADFTGYNGATSSVDSAATVDGCGAGNGGLAGKCKKKKAKKHRKHRAAESKKKHKKHGCKKKKRHKKKR